MVNTLAYDDTATTMAVKSLIVQAPDSGLSHCKNHKTRLK
jgi:hypothetical protein